MATMKYQYSENSARSEELAAVCDAIGSMTGISVIADTPLYGDDGVFTTSRELADEFGLPYSGTIEDNVNRVIWSRGHVPVPAEDAEDGLFHLE